MSTTIKLLELTGRNHPFGNVQGKEVFRKLMERIEASPSTQVFGISLEGIEATDASFPRESVLSIAKHYRGEKWFFLQGLESKDLIDNWNYAADAKEQPLVIWGKDGFEVIGPRLTTSTKALLDYVLKNRSITAAKAANDLEVSVQNASTQLKKLVDQGYIMRSEAVAESGGKEYFYLAIK